MARKRKGTSGGSVALFVILLVVALVAQIPKQVWIMLGILAGIAALVWLIKRVPSSKPSKFVEDDTYPELVADTRPTSPTGGITIQLSTANLERDFHTVQVGSPSSHSFSIPKPNAKPASVRWVKRDETITVAGLVLPAGMVYICEKANQFGQSEPSLIDATLSVSRSPVSITDIQS